MPREHFKYKSIDFAIHRGAHETCILAGKRIIMYNVKPGITQAEAEIMIDGFFIGHKEGQNQAYHAVRNATEYTIMQQIQREQIEEQPPAQERKE